MEPQPVQPAQPAQPAPQEVSQKTIVILVVLTLILSFIGAWAGISATMTPPTAQKVATSDAGSAEVSFAIEQPQQLRDNAVGMVSLDINQ